MKLWSNRLETRELWPQQLPVRLVSRTSSSPKSCALALLQILAGFGRPRKYTEQMKRWKMAEMKREKDANRCLWGKKRKPKNSLRVTKVCKIDRKMCRSSFKEDTKTCKTITIECKITNLRFIANHKRFKFSPKYAHDHKNKLGYKNRWKTLTC